MFPAQVIAGVAEGVAGQRKRRAQGEHHGHGSDGTGRPDEPAPPGSPAQAELLPAEPGPPSDRQEPRRADRPEDQRGMHHADIDHVDSREDDDDDRDRPAEAPRRRPGFLRHVSPLPAAREGADGSRAHSVYALATLTKARGDTA